MVNGNGTADRIPIPEYVPHELDGNEQVLAVVDISAEIGAGITFSAHGETGAFDAHGEASDLLRGLGQLDRTKPNILVIDGTRDFVIDPFVGKAASDKNGAFSRHPELTAIIVSRIGVYWLKDDHHYFEDIQMIQNPSPKFAIPANMLDALRTGKQPTQ